MTSRLAAIDIGSNSIKLVIAEATTSTSFAVLGREKEMVRLGHNTLRDGYLAPDAIARAADTISKFRGMAEARGASRVFTIATASVREADNAAEFVDEVERLTGLRVEILSGIEEARLIGVAAAHGCVPAGSSLVNIDIGGGSTEVSFVQDGVPVDLFSVKLGAVGLTERLIHNDPPKPKEIRALREDIRGALERPGRHLRRGKGWQYATGTSGTILALGEALKYGARPKRAPERQGNGQTQPAAADIVFSALERFNDRVAGMTLAERRGLPGISSQRADIIIAGGQILEGAMRAVGINLLQTCDWALREGVIIDRLSEIEAEQNPPLPDINDPRLRGVHSVGRRFGYEEPHAHHVAVLAEKIFDWLAPHYGFNRHQRIMLSAAAVLHDAGYFIAHDSHHKHSLYLIRNSELTGFSEAERQLMANIARYHRGALPKDRHPDYAALGEADREAVWKLGAILRLANALDRSHDGRVHDLRIVREGDRVELHLESDLDCSSEIFSAEGRRDMFEQAYDCEVVLSVNHRAEAKSA